MRDWTTAEVHEALLRWGAITARRQDGGLGYPSQASGTTERIATPYRALEPSEFTDAEFDAIDLAIRQLEQHLKVVVLCYYKPGHLRANTNLGIDGKGRQRSPSIRAIAAFLLIGKDAVDRRLQAARHAIAYSLTTAESSDRMAVSL